MRSLLIFALMISTTCLAAGPDSQEFVGLSTIGNKLMKISYASDIPQEGIDNRWFYSKLTQDFVTVGRHLKVKLNTLFVHQSQVTNPPCPIGGGNTIAKSTTASVPKKIANSTTAQYLSSETL